MAKKIINTDIYNMSKLVDDVKGEFIPEETRETLAIDMYGYIGAIESKRLQTQVMMSQELSNESFPSRARLERNVITHAITSNIQDINAIPAKMEAVLAVRQKDVDSLMKRNTFVIDRECPIYVGEYEFHLEYDIILQRITITGNENVYTAQYDMKRKNPSSIISNPYISAPAIIMLTDSEYYIFINVTLSQVEHEREYSKLVSSNIIDNKTINFHFENQLSYFEVHITEANEEKYLTPVFEGSGVPDNVIYYCWYQYIDTDKIRVRFDRNSYMPGLNAEIEILFKTTTGKAGNFPYKNDILTTFESSIYGYKNLNLIITPVSDSDDGKNRKTKKELQKLIPKEKLSRGALTTITDLNNYFGMLDSDSGRIVVQKKIDNQQERIYYAYVVLKDVNGNIVPSNTIDLKIPMKELIETSIADSKSPRYVLRSGSRIILSDDKTTGEIVSGPIKNIGLNWNTQVVNKGDDVKLSFMIRIDSDEYPDISCRALVNKKSSVYINSPVGKDCIYTDRDNTTVDAVAGMAISIGQKIRFTYEFTTSGDGPLEIKDVLHKGFRFVKDSGVLTNTKTKQPASMTTTVNPDGSVTFVTEVKNGETYSISYLVKTEIECEKDMITNVTIKNPDKTSVTINPMHLYAVILTIEKNPTELLYGNNITYHINYIATETAAPIIEAELSRGVNYVAKSSTIIINKDSFVYDPSIIDLIGDAGFLYTNPYSIVINHYHLYSAFYMMTVNTSPYLYFEYINQRSSAQFISTNIYWKRTFLGYYKNTYTMRMSLTQSIAKDLGLIEKDEETGAITKYKVKLIALFYRDGNPYRYKNLKIQNFNEETFTFNFYAELDALDLFDQDNNIKVGAVGLLNQTVEEYGFFNANTEVHIYSLCEQSDVDGRYTRYDIDRYVPGLDGWTVTNVYKVSTGLDFFYNYADIMGSGVQPYGENLETRETTSILVPDGYIVKSIPVFGYDYSIDESLVNNAIDALNYDKTYIDDAIKKCENSFGIDFKCFNTYGPSKVFYIIKDKDNNGILDDEIEFIDRTNITMYFRMRLLSRNDNYTKNMIIKDIKDYMEDLNELGEVHFPNLVTQITTNYKESLGYFEFLGFNDYGPGVQHLYKLPDKQIPIHVCPEFVNVNNVRASTDDYESLSPDINIYVSEN